MDDKTLKGWLCEQLRTVISDWERTKEETEIDHDMNIDDDQFQRVYDPIERQMYELLDRISAE